MGIIKEQEERGFIDKIDSLSPTGTVHYIPHHHVNKDTKTTPIRIVYDCGCRLSDNHPSLNDCLEVGSSNTDQFFCSTQQLFAFSVD